jgi:uncharacterized protein (TIGR03086 family)
MSTDALAAAFAATREVLANVKPHQYGDATPCAAWDVRALINHIVGGSHVFAVVARAGKVPDQAETPDVTIGDPLAAFDDGIAASLAAFADSNVLAKTLTLPFGAMPGEAFLRLATLETFTHGWDLAKATGQSTDLHPQLAQALLADARQTIPDTVRGSEPTSPFGPIVTVAETAPAADQLAGFLGRQP